MAEFVERAILRVNGVDLDDVIIDVSEDSTRPTKAVHTMNKERVPRGFKQGNNSYSLEISAERIFDPVIPDWHAMKDAGTPISVVIIPNVGPAVTYSQGRITSVRDATSDGDSSRKISAMFRRRK